MSEEPSARPEERRPSDRALRGNASALLRDGLPLRGWQAVVHLALAATKPLVMPLFLLSGVLLIATGRTDDDGVVAVGPSALDDGWRDLVDPALVPAVVAFAIGLLALFGGLSLSYVISRRIVPGPGTGGPLKRLITGGVGYRDRWAYTKAVNGLRLPKATTARAAAAVDATHPGVGHRAVRIGRWLKWAAWTVLGLALVALWATGTDTTFRWG